MFLRFKTIFPPKFNPDKNVVYQRAAFCWRGAHESKSAAKFESKFWREFTPYALSNKLVEWKSSSGG